MLGHQSSEPFGHGLGIDRRAARARTEEIVREFNVSTPGIDVPAYALSGGNQQKLIVGREMTSDPSLLIASHPTEASTSAHRPPCGTSCATLAMRGSRCSWCRPISRS